MSTILYTPEEFELYKLIRKVADIVAEEINREKHPYLLPIFQFQSGLNPYLFQTTGGLALEDYNSVIGPMGLWTFLTTVSRFDPVWPRITKQITQRLGLTLLTPDHGDGSGPQYGIHRVDDIELPTPQLKERRADFIAPDIADVKWGQMVARYKAENA